MFSHSTPIALLHILSTPAAPLDLALAPETQILDPALNILTMGSVDVREWLRRVAG